MSVLEKGRIGKPCQRVNTGIVNPLSKTKEIPTFSPFFKGGSRGIKRLLQSPLLRNGMILLFGQPLSITPLRSNSILSRSVYMSKKLMIRNMETIWGK